MTATLLHRPRSQRSALLAAALCALACDAPPAALTRGPTSGWPEYGADKGGSRYARADQISRENVEHLEVAWEYHTGDYDDGSTGLAPSTFQNTPILHDGMLYLCTPFNNVIALDAETGVERWRHDLQVDSSQFYSPACRGVSFWRDEAAEPGAACRRRVISGTLDARLIALDASTGRPCPEFGVAGSVDLAEGIGDRQPGEYGVTSPPAIVSDLIVTGAMVLDNRRVDAPGGVIRAFDARSGELRWAWDPVAPGKRPKVGGDVAYQRGTTNAWSMLSADPELGLVYVPTGNTSPDYFGGHRDGGDYYSSSVVALDVETGKVRWHFQTTHHDVWDYDLPAQPVLFSYPGPEGDVPALAQATKTGLLFLLDRRDGTPIFPVEERPVPGGALDGDFVAETQPFPTKPAPLHPLEPLRPEDAFGFTLYDRGKCREAIEAARSEGLYTPPSLQGSVHFPGMMGGVNWGSLAVDSKRDILVVNTTRTATTVRMIPRDEITPKQKASKYGFEPAEGTPYAVERRPLLSPFGAPCNPPPWGTLTGIDIESGEHIWQTPLGTTRDMAPWPLWLDTGTPNQGGPIVTASGLVFIAATTDNFLRAFDTRSGEELWRGRLPAGGQATPMTYRLTPEGRQYVVIAAGGHGVLGTRVGDSVVAFALPAP
ncbi:MAG: pyrroloquinoline quinone-dependent dehydrogenase [Deltaproteobacteria bacterium]|nr:pyrroloquinoline quinone-dependent dehydrogenase [Deltaproteobacteria bacterium]